jgi:hypothetical protein
MKLCWLLGLAFWLLVGVPPASAADGTFRGKITDPPGTEPAVKGWIFVEGMNHMLRRVEVAHAAIVFGEEVPAGRHRTCNADCLKAGQEVRVTAHQDSTGEWRATRVEILTVSPKPANKSLEAGTLPNFTRFLAPPQVTNIDRFCIATSTGEI